jgi:hypothetical protein
MKSIHSLAHATIAQLAEAQSWWHGKIMLSDAQRRTLGELRLACEVFVAKCKQAEVPNVSHPVDDYLE